MISRELQATLNIAVNEVVRRRHEYLTLEHVLYALLFDGTASKAIRRCGGDLEKLRADLEQFSTCAAGESVKEAGKRIDKTESEMGNCGSNQPKKRGNCHESA
ncbi:MAG: hypothetical protein K1Y36_20470, partial [Blastocatellia bacterium]|nr:hypothetical protein [Blastocatellia bacterium]